jgi:hypothetical protein
LRRFIHQILIVAASTFGVLLSSAQLHVAKVYAQETAPSASEVKAALLYNFARYVQWPDDYLSDSDSLVFGVYGGTGEEAILQRMLSGKSIAGKEIVVRAFQNPDELVPTHVLLIATRDLQEVRKVLDSVGSESTVTVGDMENFLKEGGVINFTRAQESVRFEINMGAAQRARLKISSALTRLADRVVR